MANRWEKKKKKETVADFIFLASKIAADSDCSHEIKRHLLLDQKKKKKKKKTLTNLKGESESCSVMSDYLQPHGL